MGAHPEEAARREAYRKRLLFIQETTGSVTPQTVVDDARNPKSPLHDAFDWDDKSAANGYRVYQARVLIQSYWTEVRTERHVIEVPFYVKDPNQGGHDQGYVTAASVRRRPAMAARVFLTELKRAHTYLNRALSMAAPLDTTAEVEEIIAKVAKLETFVGEEWPE